MNHLIGSVSTNDNKNKSELSFACELTAVCSTVSWPKLIQLFPLQSDLEGSQKGRATLARLERGVSLSEQITVNSVFQMIFMDFLASTYKMKRIYFNNQRSTVISC